MMPRRGPPALPRNQILVGDAATIMAELPAASVDCVITSPPYFRLRDYAVDGQIGLEDAVEVWVDALRAVLEEAARVLKPSGSMWLNLADTYSRHSDHGAAPKSLVLGPERVAIAMVDAGWTIRNKVIWAKTNPMPASVGDRLAATWEALYFATRSRRYFFDLDAIRVPHTSRHAQRPKRARPAPTAGKPAWAGPAAGSNSGLASLKASGRAGHRLGKNPGDVWRLATANYTGAHFATFPPRLVEQPLAATCPERVCESCGTPWRPARRERTSRGQLVAVGNATRDCSCRAGWRPGVVLDPFAGSGTVAATAAPMGRDWIGIELNPAFARLARDRIAATTATPPDNGPHRREGPVAA